jgi:hypothetical protein
MRTRAVCAMVVGLENRIFHDHCALPCHRFAATPQHGDTRALA